MNFSVTGVLGMALAVSTMAGMATAQVSTNRVAANTDWSVFVEGNPAVCWGVSAPKETINTRDGKPAQVQRGDILLYVTYRQGGKAEVSFTGGYSFAPGQPVQIEIAGATVDLFVDGEWAFAAPGKDDEIITALKAGQSAVVTGTSARGTKTQDTFSLSGFSAAVEEAAKRCGG